MHVVKTPIIVVNFTLLIQKCYKLFWPGQYEHLLPSRGRHERTFFYPTLTAVSLIKNTCANFYKHV